MKLKVFEAFSGYGSQSMALERLGIEYEVVGISEIDRYAIQAYMAVHGDVHNFGDISKINWGGQDMPDFDLFTYSFPCTDISSAGQQKGLEEGSGTRSSLLWECRKAIEIKKPKYLLMENVKALTSNKFRPYLRKWIEYLSSLGYSSFTKVLNAKDYGVPQNRERVFVVSIMGDEKYSFPKPFELDKRLKDVLEADVDESFYLSKKAIDGFNLHKERMKQKGNGFGWEPTDGDCIASAVLTTAGSRPDDNFIIEKAYGNKRVQSLVESGKISGEKIEFLDAYNQTVSDICGTIKTTVHSSSMSFISEPVTCAIRGRNPENTSDRRPGIPMTQRVEMGGNIANCITTVQKDSLLAEPFNVEKDGCCRTLKSNYYKVSSSNILDNDSGGAKFKATGVIEHHNIGIQYRIRKLTPRECFRLMGVSEEDIDKIQSSGVSKTQQYKMAGNSIVVDVLYHIFRKMFVDKRNEEQQLSLF